VLVTNVIKKEVYPCDQSSCEMWVKGIYLCCI